MFLICLVVFLWNSLWLWVMFSEVSGWVFRVMMKVLIIVSIIVV